VPSSAGERDSSSAKLFRADPDATMNTRNTRESVRAHAGQTCRTVALLIGPSRVQIGSGTRPHLAKSCSVSTTRRVRFPLDRGPLAALAWHIARIFFLPDALRLALRAGRRTLAWLRAMMLVSARAALELWGQAESSGVIEPDHISKAGAAWTANGEGRIKLALAGWTCRSERCAPHHPERLSTHDKSAVARQERTFRSVPPSDRRRVTNASR